jgi:uncharacterized SAM-binding protein YcdF (DUF218 family)
MSFKPLELFRTGRVQRTLLVASVILVAWSLLAWVAARWLIISDDLPHADAMVVLAGSAAYMERAHRAAQLFHEGRAPKIILTNDNTQTGWSSELERNPFFIERAAWELEGTGGVPESSIEMLQPTVSSTYDEATLLREYAHSHGLRSLLIVTSAYHSRRALWIFRKVFEGSGVNIGIEVIAPGEQTPPPATWWLYLRGWRAVAVEYVKLLYYWVRYR